MRQSRTGLVQSELNWRVGDWRHHQVEALLGLQLFNFGHHHKVSCLVVQYSFDLPLFLYVYYL